MEQAEVTVRRLRTCEICGTEYRPTYGEQRTCGRRCGAALQRAGALSVGRWGGRTCSGCGRRTGSRSRSCPDCRPPVPAERPCIECGTLFAPADPRQFICCAECRRSRGNRASSAAIVARYHSDPEFRDRVIAAAQSRRAERLGLPGCQVLLTYLVKRDHGRCGICHKPVRAHKGLMRPSIDHIVPLSVGGTHELTNVQLAHYRCNLRKCAAGGGEQLLLIG